MIPAYIASEPAQTVIERSILDSLEIMEEETQSAIVWECDRIDKRRDLAIALEEFCRHERFMKRLEAGEFENREKKLKKRIANGR